jgi:hypothetical protein
MAAQDGVHIAGQLSTYAPHRDCRHVCLFTPSFLLSLHIIPPSPPFFSRKSLPQNKLAERRGGYIARSPTHLHRELLFCGAQHRTAQRATAPDQATSARRRDVRGPPRRGRVGERVRPVPVQRAARRAWSRGTLAPALSPFSSANGPAGR